MVLALGVTALRARLQREERDGTTWRARPHPIPDLPGESVEVIVEAVLGAIVAAHSAEWTIDALGSDPACASCSALIDVASRYGDPTEKLWPDPVRRHLADLIDIEFAARAK